jgi:murein DD-endopeptidase MepM/ murein hydrolase activator NlpD
VFNGAYRAALGVDYRGALGDPICAANRGVVALDTFFLAGNVVYINHGDDPSRATSI